MIYGHARNWMCHICRVIRWNSSIAHKSKALPWYCEMSVCLYRVVSRCANEILLVVVFCGLSSGVWSELSRVFIELRVSDMDIKTLSKTELGSESSVCWRVLRTPFTGPPICSSSLKSAIHRVSSDSSAVSKNWSTIAYWKRSNANWHSFAEADAAWNNVSLSKRVDNVAWSHWHNLLKEIYTVIFIKKPFQRLFLWFLIT